MKKKNNPIIDESILKMNHEKWLSITQIKQNNDRTTNIVQLFFSRNKYFAQILTVKREIKNQEGPIGIG